MWYKNLLKISFVIKNLILLPNYFFLLSVVKSIRVIILGNFSDYSGLSPRIALNQLFYRVQFISISKFSRNGVSNLIGGGRYNLSNWWHLPIVSLSLFANAQAVVVLWGGLGIIGSLFYIDLIHNNHLTYAFLPLLSTLFLFNVISYQNYNIFGLIFVAPLLYSLATAQTFCFAVLAIFLPFFSITITAIIAPVILVTSVSFDSYHWFLIFCVCAPFAGASLIFTSKKQLAENFSWVFTAMGISVSENKLKRSDLKKLITTRDLYLLFSYTLGIVCLWYVQSDFIFQACVFPLVHFVNRKLFKFSDDENISAVFSISFIFFLIFSDSVDYISITLAFLTLFEPSKSVERLSLVNTAALIERLQFFLGDNSKGPILLCFHDPQNTYEKLFDNQRILVEPASCACSLNNRLMIPDWWAVFNRDKLENFWIKSPSDLLRVAKDYGVREYISTSPEIDNFFDENFEFIEEFDWGSIYLSEFGQEMNLDLRLESSIIWKKYQINSSLFQKLRQ